MEITFPRLAYSLACFYFTLFHSVVSSDVNCYEEARENKTLTFIGMFWNYVRNLNFCIGLSFARNVVTL